ncbi:MAG: hypothetical protein KGL39_44240 [Patescibacteria group bacterium]|nr:hypothetical protein [Patescibacteria group bacterium]
MSEFEAEKSEMSCVEFASFSLRERIAPPNSAQSVKERIRLASRRLGWSFSRAKDVWYADPRVAIGADEMRAIEEAAGIRYGRDEIRKNDELISKAEALLEGADSDFYSAFVVALRSALGIRHRPGT